MFYHLIILIKVIFTFNGENKCNNTFGVLLLNFVVGLIFIIMVRQIDYRLMTNMIGSDIIIIYLITSMFGDKIPLLLGDLIVVIGYRNKV